MNRSTDLARIVSEQSRQLDQAATPAAFIAAVTELAASAAARTLAEQQHPGISVTIPAPPVALTPVAAPRSRRMFTRAELAAYMGVSAGSTAASCGIASLFTSSPITWGAACVGGMLVSFGAAIVSHHDDVTRIEAAR